MSNTHHSIVCRNEQKLICEEQLVFLMKKLTLVKTADGSFTFYNSFVDEQYHSKSGALDEALKKHVLPSNILQDAKIKKNVVIADVCFGLGYNSLVALTLLWDENPHCHVTLYAFENDKEILAHIKEIKLPQKYAIVKTKILHLIEHGAYKDEYLSAKLFMGDVREQLQHVANASIHVVFFDPFSPKKQPELWTKEVFSLLHEKMKQGSILTTYSCARMARDNMKQVGFLVFDGPRVGRRSPGTIAKKR